MDVSSDALPFFKKDVHASIRPPSSLVTLWPRRSSFVPPFARVGGRGRRVRRKGKSTQEERDAELVEKVVSLRDRMMSKVKMIRETLVASFRDVPGMEDLDDRFQEVEEKFMNPQEREASVREREARRYEMLDEQGKKDFLLKKEEEAALQEREVLEEAKRKEDEEWKQMMDEMQLYFSGALDQEMTTKPMWLRKKMHPSYLHRPDALKMQLPQKDEDKLALDMLGSGSQGANILGCEVPGMRDYAWAMYCNCNNARAMLANKWAGRDPNLVLSNSEYYQDIIKHAPGMELTLMVKTSKDLSVEKFRRDYGNRLYKKLEEYGASAAEGRSLAELLSCFSAERLQGLPFMKNNKVLKGSHLIFSVGLNGELIAEVQDPRELRYRQQFQLGICKDKQVSRAVFDLFLGDQALQNIGKLDVGNGFLYALNGFTWSENPRNPRQVPETGSSERGLAALSGNQKNFKTRKFRPHLSQYEIPGGAFVEATADGKCLKGLLLHGVTDALKDMDVQTKAKASVAEEERRLQEEEIQRMQRELVESIPKLMEEESQRADEMEMLGPYSPSMNQMLLSPDLEGAEEIRGITTNLIMKPLRDHLIKTGQLEPGSKEDRERFRSLFSADEEESTNQESTSVDFTATAAK